MPKIPFFQNLEPAQVALLKPLFEQFVCPPGTTIFEQGEPAGYLYLLIKGEAAIQYKPYDTPPITLTRLHDGDVFGWSAVTGNPYYTSTVISETKIEALRIRGNHLLTVVREHPETGKVILDHLADAVGSRWKNAHEQVRSLLNSNHKK